MGSMLESIFFVITTLFSLLFLILAVSLESWPCGGVFANSCQTYLHQLNDRVRHIAAYVALGTSVISSLFVSFDFSQSTWSLPCGDRVRDGIVTTIENLQ
ncbi:hypothetical protein TcWFU_008091 [Taenia crassiceps]|uniref:Transmembrane protein n=1 Tax=Taenia crassiceps TaxID=6207 RepID=A0ABR4QEG7_9CEST